MPLQTEIDLPPDVPSRRALLTVSEAAELLGRPRSTVYEWLAGEVMPAAVVVQVGRRRYVRRDALVRWLRGDLA
jgi:excisionase family DNA binding protein